MATKASATTAAPTAATSAAFNSYFYQQAGTNGAGGKPAAPAMAADHRTSSSSNEQQAADLHLKMSKKIAQLTKVIYALNSRNDESENLVAQLRAQHEEDRERLLLETGKKLEEYKQKVLTSSDQAKKIADLESSLNEFQRQREQALKDFEEFKLSSLQTEESLALRHKQEMIDLNRMLEDVRQEQDKQFRHFDALGKKFETEKLYLLEDLKSKQRLEIESLKQAFNSSREATLGEHRKALMEKHEADVSKLRQELKVVQARAGKDKSDYEQSISKLKLFHEKELDASRQNSSSEYMRLMESLKEEMARMSKDRASLESNFNERYDRKLAEIATREEEVAALRASWTECKASVLDSNEKIVELNKQVSLIFFFFFAIYIFMEWSLLNFKDRRIEHDQSEDSVGNGGRVRA